MQREFSVMRSRSMSRLRAMRRMLQSFSLTPAFSGRPEFVICVKVIMGWLLLSCASQFKRRGRCGITARMRHVALCRRPPILRAPPPRCLNSNAQEQISLDEIHDVDSAADANGDVTAIDVGEIFVRLNGAKDLRDLSVVDLIRRNRVAAIGRGHCNMKRIVS